MMLHKLSCTLTIALVGALAGWPSFARADLDIYQLPLFLTSPVKPGLVVGLDDSGSMDAEVIFPTNDAAAWWNMDNQSFTGLDFEDEPQDGVLNFNNDGGATNTWKKFIYLFPNGCGANDERTYCDNTNDHFAVPPIPAYGWSRSPEFNPQYFDPDSEYSPWANFDDLTFDNADPTAAESDPNRGTTVHDLTSSFAFDADNEGFPLFPGMTVPAGTRIKLRRYRRQWNNGNCAGFTDVDRNWVTLASDYVVPEQYAGNNLCYMDVAFEYFPATFYLPVSQPPQPSFGYNAVPELGAFAPDGTPLARYEIRPGNFASNALYQEAIQNFANWFQYYRKRAASTRASIGQAFAEESFLRAGVFTINNRVDVTMEDFGDPDDLASFMQQVYNLRGSGGTPNKQAVLHMGRQFERIGNDAPVLQSCQRNFGMLFTDGFSNDWDGAGVGNTDSGQPAPLGDAVSNTMADIAFEFYDNNIRGDLEAGKVPVPSQCNQADPPLWLDCNPNPHMNLFGIVLGVDGLIFNVDEAATENPYENPPTWPTDFYARHPSAVDDLWHATINTRGEMFSTKRPDELVTALQSVLTSIDARVSSTGLTGSSSRLNVGTLIYSAEFDSTDWSGDLVAFSASDESETWSAADLLNERNLNTDPRSIWTCCVGGETGGVPFDTNMSDELLSLIHADSDAAEQIVEYIQGFDPNPMFRDRDNLMADIVNSVPVFSGPGNEGWARLGGDVGEAYLEYIDGDKQDRGEWLFVGANGGLLHAFDASDEASGGTEAFAYAPKALFPHLGELADPDYSHRFFVDGQITVADAYVDNEWKTILVATYGAGGRGIVALDVTNPDGFSSDDVLWEYTAADDEDIGHIFGHPTITRFDDDNFYAVFGNGYNSTSGDATLMAIRLDNGDISRVTLDDGPDRGLGSPAVWENRFGTNTRHAARAYAGDLEGSLWRVDLEGGMSSHYGNNPLVDVERPITATPTVAAHPGGGLMVFFGSGKYIEDTDILSGAGVDMESFFAIRDQGDSLNNLNNLSEVEMSDGGDGTRTITADSGGVGDDGWRLDLDIVNGERSITRPRVVFGQVLFSTFEPSESICDFGGTARLYLMNALNGSGRLNLGEGQCSSPPCGAVTIGSGGGPLVPPVFIQPPQTTPPGDDDDDDDDGGDDGDGGNGDPTDASESWGSVICIPIIGQECRRIGTIKDGRQGWRQQR